MGEETRKRTNGVRILRWIARVTGTLMGGFWLVMFIGETWGKFGKLQPTAVVMASLMTVYAFSMLAAWFFERAGAVVGLVTLAAFFAILAVINSGFLLNPLLLVFWLPVVLYLFCWVSGVRNRSTTTSAA